MGRPRNRTAPLLFFKNKETKCQSMSSETKKKVSIGIYDIGEEEKRLDALLDDFLKKWGDQIEIVEEAFNNYRTMDIICSKEIEDQIPKELLVMTTFSNSE